MSLSRFSESEINNSINPWVITRKIGSGASGEVYEIVREDDPLLRRALKTIRIPSDESEIDLLKAKGMSDQEIKEYYKDAAEGIVSTIRAIRSFGPQDHIASYEDPAMFVNHDNIGWTVLIQMELLKPLDEVSPRGDLPDRREVMRLGIEMCSALQVCHSHNMMHRDIKPANILVDEKGTFKLLDFGIARIKEKTITNISARGTESYMAPEIIRKETSHTGDFSADIYSLGIMLFEMLNDHRFPTNPDYPCLRTREDDVFFLSSKIRGDFPFITKHEKGQLIDVIAKACSRKIDQRFKSAEEMKAALEEVMKYEPTMPLHNEKDYQIVTFGHYPQGQDDEGGYISEPIRWLVLEDRPNNMVLLSEKILDAKAFHEEKEDVTWEGSTLRSWLNGYSAENNDYGLDYTKDSFIGEAFDENEKKRMIPIQGDLVSLLSEDEVYGTDRAEKNGFCYDRTMADRSRTAVATAYAAENGAHKASGFDTSVWWLRSQGTRENRSQFVDMRGVVACNGATVYDRSFGIRPVISIRKNELQKMKTAFEGWNFVLEETADGPKPKRLGKGGYGSVFEIEKEGNIDFRSALKVISIPNDVSIVKQYAAEGMNREQILQLLEEEKDKAEQEIRLQNKAKSNPNIVGIEDYAIKEKKNGLGWLIYIRMELLKSIGEMEPGTLSPEDVRKLGIDICNALEECHNNGILHRDIKPGNLFVDDGGYYKLGDFGISRVMEGTSGIISRTATEKYAAPEVIKVRKHGPAADMYSLGLVMYELLNNGRLPFLPPSEKVIMKADRDAAVAQRMRGEEIKPIEGVPDDLNAAIIKACAYNPDDRFSSAAEMKKWLQGEAEIEDVRKDVSKTGSKTARGKIVSVIVIVAVCVAFAAMFFLENDDTQVSNTEETNVSESSEATENFVYPDTEVDEDADLSTFPEFRGKTITVSNDEEFEEIIEDLNNTYSLSSYAIIEVKPGNYTFDTALEIQSENIKIVGVGDSKPVINCPINAFGNGVMLENISVKITGPVKGDSGWNGICCAGSAYLRNVDVDLEYTTKTVAVGITGDGPLKMEGCYVNVNHGESDGNVAVQLHDKYSINSCTLESNGPGIEFIGAINKEITDEKTDELVNNNNIKAKSEILTYGVE